ASAGVLRVGVDVGGDDVRLDLVTGDVRFAVPVTDRVDQPEQFPRALDLSGGGERHDRPDGGVRILPAILANAGDVALDVTWIQVRLVERRVEQLDHADVALHEMGV